MDFAPSSSASPVSATICPDCAGSVSAASDRCSTCGQTRPRGGWPLDPHLGRVIAGRYHLEAKIGSGGNGVVYRASDRANERQLGPVVVKLLMNGPEGNGHRRFLTETRVARRVTSPHAVKVYDFGTEISGPYVVMELLIGKTLRALLRERGALSVEETLSIGLQVCDALGDAHHHGVVHRDLKPENLMLLSPAHTFVKVLDFGAAVVTGPEATRSMVGTPRYMAPEQIEERAVDARADVYALGIVLFEMLSGKVPFERSTAVETMNAHRHESIPPLSRDAVPASLARLVESLLAKAPEDRPASMAEVANVLRVIADASASTSSASSPATELTPAKRSPRHAAAAALLSLGAALLLGGYLWSTRTSGAPQPGAGPATPRREDAPAVTTADPAQSQPIVVTALGTERSPPRPAHSASPRPEVPPGIPTRSTPAPTPLTSSTREPSAPAPSASAIPSQSEVPRAGKLHVDEF